MVVASAFQGLGRAAVPLTVMAVRVALVVAAALAATRLLGGGAETIFAIIAAGNVCSCLALWRSSAPRCGDRASANSLRFERSRGRGDGRPPLGSEPAHSGRRSGHAQNSRLPTRR